MRKFTQFKAVTAKKGNTGKKKFEQSWNAPIVQAYVFGEVELPDISLTLGNVVLNQMVVGKRVV